MKNLFGTLLVISLITASTSAQSNKVVFGPLEGDDAGVLTVRNGEEIEIEMWVRTDPDNAQQIESVQHGLMSEDIIIEMRNGFGFEPPYNEWFYSLDGPYYHDPSDPNPIPENWTCEVQWASCGDYTECDSPLDTGGEWDLYGTWFLVVNTGVPTDQIYFPLMEGWYPSGGGGGTRWSFDPFNGDGVIPEQSYCGLYFEPYPCLYIPGDCDHNGTPLELNDVLAMIGFYRGAMEPYQCECGEDPTIYNLAATADPNGNCIPNELNDVVTEIGAYRGSDTVSGCPDCPGSGGLLRKRR